MFVFHAFSNTLLYGSVRLGLALHAAEATAYSGLPNLVAGQVSDEYGTKDALFEAEDAATWYGLFAKYHSDKITRAASLPIDDATISQTPEIFLPTAIFSQSLVNIYLLREIRKNPLDAILPSLSLSTFYTQMIEMAKSNHMEAIHTPERKAAPHIHSLCVIWHYMCAVNLSPMDLIEDAAGRNGIPTYENDFAIGIWANLPQARLAAIHCGMVLYHAEDLRDLAFLVPR